MSYFEMLCILIVHKYLYIYIYIKFMHARMLSSGSKYAETATWMPKRTPDCAPVVRSLIN